MEGQVWAVALHKKKLVCDLRTSLRIDADDFVVREACFCGKCHQESLKLAIRKAAGFHLHFEDRLSAIEACDVPILGHDA